MTILCPQCGQATPPADACPSCQAPLLLKERYRLLYVLGEGTGITYLAQDALQGVQVVIKELATRRMESWKSQDLFLREAQVLQQLDHPAIPRYKDSFTLGSGRREALYLVQEHIEGFDLAREAEARRYTEEEVMEALDQVLGVLEYLQDLRPPVVHRDIKPANIVRRPDGSLALIDFGAVKDALRGPRTGETVAGTFGYMAPEQLRGEALPESDLYSLGVVALSMLSRRPPEAFLSAANQLEWRGRVIMSPGMEGFLDALLRPDPADRPEGARQARELLRRAQAPSVTLSPEIRAPSVPPEAAPPALLAEKVEAPAEAKPHLVLIGVLVTIFVAGLICIPLSQRGNDQGRATAKSADPHRDLPACAPQECQPVPQGLKGLTFGMTLEQARQALPEARDVEAQDPPTIVDPTTILNPGRMVFLSPEGHYLNVSTTLGDLPCTCELTFLDKSTLSLLSCAMTPLSSQEAHVRVERELLGQLQAKYGQATRFDDLAALYRQDKLNRRWTWEGQSSTLSLSSHYEGSTAFPLSNKAKLVVECRSEAHTKAIQALEDQVARQRAAERAREEQRKQAEDRERLQRLERSRLGDEL